VNGDGEAKILEEITAGGLPSSIRAELVPEHERPVVCGECGHENRAGVTTCKACGACWQVVDVSGYGLGRIAPPVAALPETLAAPAVCGQNYQLGKQVFPEKCSLPAGHKPRTSTSNHYCFGIGWWA
jgi:hypothetical protein